MAAYEIKDSVFNSEVIFDLNKTGHLPNLKHILVTLETFLMLPLRVLTAQLSHVFVAEEAFFPGAIYRLLHWVDFGLKNW